MTIGFDGSRAFIKKRTGTENYSFELLKHLSKIDRQNKYIVYLRPGNVVASHDWPENFQFKMINLSRLWTQLGLFVHTFIDPIDILFVPAHTLPIFKKPGLKTVLTVHDLGSEYLPYTHQLKQRLYLRFITRYQLTQATRLIAVSNSTKNDLIKRIGISPGKVEVIYEGVDREFFKTHSIDQLNSILKYYDIEKNSYFLFVGTIQPRKNLIRLIKAFKGFLNIMESSKNPSKNPSKFSSDPEKMKELRSYKLILAGGKGWMADEVYNLPAKLGIEDSVKFLGRVKDEELASLYGGAAALVYPSLFEGFGLPILEAFSSGCPVITSNISSMPEIVQDAGILVDPYSIEQIIEAMLKVADDKNLRDNLINKGYKRAHGLNWAECAKNTLEVLQRL